MRPSSPHRVIARAAWRGSIVACGVVFPKVARHAALVAQWIEHLPPKQGVARSIRAEGSELTEVMSGACGARLMRGYAGVEAWTSTGRERTSFCMTSRAAAISGSFTSGDARSLVAVVCRRSRPARSPDGAPLVVICFDDTALAGPRGHGALGRRDCDGQEGSPPGAGGAPLVAGIAVTVMRDGREGNDSFCVDGARSPDSTAPPPPFV